MNHNKKHHSCCSDYNTNNTSLAFVIPSEYLGLYARILSALTIFGEEDLKDCKSRCSSKSSIIIECFNMFNAAMAANAIDKTKLRDTIIKYIEARLNSILPDNKPNDDMIILLRDNCCHFEHRPGFPIHPDFPGKPDDDNTNKPSDGDNSGTVPPTTDADFNITLDIDNNSVDESSHTLTGKVNTSNDTTWTIQSSSWVHIAPTSGTGSKDIAIAIDANESESDREGYIILSSEVDGETKTFVYTINQSAAKEEFIFDVSSFNYNIGSNNIFTTSSNSTTIDFWIDTNDNCSWKITASDFVTIHPSTGEGTLHDIKVNINENTITADRSGYILFTGNFNGKTTSVLYQFIQKAKFEDDKLELDETVLEFEYDYETKSVVITTTSNDYKTSISGDSDYFTFETDDTGVNSDGTIWIREKVSIAKENTTGLDVAAVITYTLGSISKTLTLILKPAIEEGGGDDNGDTPTDPDNGDNGDTGDSGDNGDTEDNTGGDNNNGDDNSSSTTTPTNMWIKVAASELEFDYAKGSQNTVEVTYSHPDLKRHLNIDTSKFNYYEEDVTTNSDGSITRRYTITTMSENTTGKDITDTFGFDYWYYSYINACTNLTQKPKTTTDTTVTPTTKYSYFKSNDTVAASAINLTESSIKQWTKVTNSLTSNDDTSINIEDTVYETEGNYFFGVAIPSSWSIKFINNTSKQDEIDIMSTATINITDPHDDGSSDVVEYTVYYFEGHPTIRGDETFTIKITN
jgi:hypothetical protein